MISKKLRKLLFKSFKCKLECPAKFVRIITPEHMLNYILMKNFLRQLSTILVPSKVASLLPRYLECIRCHYVLSGFQEHKPILKHPKVSFQI